MIETLIRDLRFAARGLRRTPGFTAVAVLTLALGIGATTAVFSVVYAVLLRPLPFPHADRLVQIVQVLEPTPNNPQPTRGGLTPDQFIALQRHSRTLAAVGGYSTAPRTLTGVDVPVRLSGAAVTPELFAQLGVPAALGRVFVAEDAERPIVTDPVVILSHQTWVRYFGADPDIIERRISLSDTRPLVIGVMPEGFGFPSLASASLARDSTGSLQDAPEFWLALAPKQPSDGGSGFSLFEAFAVLREDVSPEQALSEIRSLLPPLPQGRKATVELVTARREMARQISDVLTIFQLGVTLILLIACVNVTNLLLTRAAHRRREVAIRAALGASRARLTAGLIVESTILALAGGAIGCVLAYALVEVIRALPPHLLPRLSEIRVDGVVLLFASALSVGAGLAVGLYSALRGRTASSDGVASHALRGVTSSTQRRLRPSGALVVAEVAATMVLVTAAGLLINSFARLMSVNPGLEPEGAVTFRVALPNSRYPSADAQQAFVTRALTTMRGIPGIDSASATDFALESGPLGLSGLVIDGRPTRGEVSFRSITPDYFRSLGIRMRQGREFADADRSSVATQVVVNETFARRYLDGGAWVGRHIGYRNRPSLEIVGVAADMTVRLGEQALPTLFLPVDAQAFFVIPSFLLRVSVDPGAVVPRVREIVSRIDPQLAVYNVMTVDEMIAHASASPRLYGLVSFWCAVIALLLAGIGLYGVLAYSVGARTREFGIRMALGASAGAVMAGVMRKGLGLTVAGIVIGLGGAYYASTFLETLLFEVTPRDRVTFGAAAAMFLAVAMVACYFPARRATRVDPVVALRAE